MVVVPESLSEAETVLAAGVPAMVVVMVGAAVSKVYEPVAVEQEEVLVAASVCCA